MNHAQTMLSNLEKAYRNKVKSYSGKPKLDEQDFNFEVFKKDYQNLAYLQTLTEQFII